MGLASLIDLDGGPRRPDRDLLVMKCYWFGCLILNWYFRRRGLLTVYELLFYHFYFSSMIYLCLFLYMC